MNHFISDNITVTKNIELPALDAQRVSKDTVSVANNSQSSSNPNVVVTKLCDIFPECFDVSEFISCHKIKPKSGRDLIVEKNAKTSTFIKKLTRQKTFDDKDVVDDEVYFQDCMNEIYLCSTLKNENIIEPNEILYFQDEFYLVFELGDCTLFELIEKVKLEEPHIKIIIKQILKALKYMHKQGVSHQDIKLENIVLFGETLKIIDFGSAKLRSQENKRIMGSEPYMAPELFEVDISNGPQLDIWSVGIILIALTTRKFPWEIATFDDMEYGEFSIDRKHKLEQIIEPFVKDSTKNDIIDFLDICLDPDVLLRADIDKLINHSYIQK